MAIADNIELDAQVPAASARRQSIRHPEASLLRLQVLMLVFKVGTYLWFVIWVLQSWEGGYVVVRWC